MPRQGSASPVPFVCMSAMLITSLLVSCLWSELRSPFIRVRKPSPPKKRKSAFSQATTWGASVESHYRCRKFRRPGGIRQKRTLSVLVWLPHTDKKREKDRSSLLNRCQKKVNGKRGGNGVVSMMSQQKRREWNSTNRATTWKENRIAPDFWASRPTTFK